MTTDPAAAYSYTEAKPQATPSFSTPSTGTVGSTAAALKPAPFPNYGADVIPVSLPHRAQVLQARESSLAEAADDCLTRFFASLSGTTPPPNLHTRVMSQVEKPLIEHVLRYVNGNQLRAAELLGINRNTLRKKIALLGINIGQLTGRRAGM